MVNPRPTTRGRLGISSWNCRPEWSTQTGDHLGVLPRNNIDLIRRVMARFGLDAGTYVTINPTGGGTYTHLPLGEADATARRPRRLCRAAGRCHAERDWRCCPGTPAIPQEAAELLAMSGLDEAGQGGLPRKVARAAQVGARTPRRLPERRPSVQRLPGVAAADATALLLHLLLPRRYVDLPPDGRGAARAGP